MLFVLLVALAHAGPLTPSWPAQPIRYHLEAVIDTPRSFRHVGGDNLEARATRHAIRADVSCLGGLKGKHWAVRCEVDEFSFDGHASRSKDVELKRIFEQYAALLRGATVELTILDNGRVKALVVDGPEKSDALSGKMLETCQLFVRRLFSPLDLQLPKDGDPKAKPWRQRGSPMALELLTRFGTAGGLVLRHEVTGQDGSIYDIRSQGRGSVTSGDTLEAGAGALMGIQTTGQGQFDSADGLILWREISTQAKFTVSAYDAGGAGVDYALVAWVGRIAEDGEVQTPPVITDPERIRTTDQSERE